MMSVSIRSAGCGRARGAVIRIAGLALLCGALSFGRPASAEVSGEGSTADLGQAAVAELAEHLKDVARRLRSRIDLNGDGHLQREETPIQFRPFFGLMDTDRDGSLTEKDAEKMARLNPLMRNEALDFSNPDALWETMLGSSADQMTGFDRNRDGLIQRLEIPSTMAGIFALFDANGDGTLDLSDDAAETYQRPDGGDAEDAVPSPLDALSGLPMPDLNTDLSDISPELEMVRGALVTLLDRNGNGLMDDEDREAIRKEIRGGLEKLADDLARAEARMDERREHWRAEMEQRRAELEHRREETRRELRDLGEVIAAELDSRGEVEIWREDVPFFFHDLFDAINLNGDDVLDRADREHWRERRELMRERLLNETERRLREPREVRPQDERPRGGLRAAVDPIREELRHMAEEVLRELREMRGGRLQRKDVPPRLMERFEQLDMNGDGVLDEADDGAYRERRERLRLESQRNALEEFRARALGQAEENRRRLEQARREFESEVGAGVADLRGLLEQSLEPIREALREERERLRRDLEAERARMLRDMDLNGDGVVDREDINAAVDERMRARGAGKDPAAAGPKSL